MGRLGWLAECAWRLFAVLSETCPCRNAASRLSWWECKVVAGRERHGDFRMYSLLTESRAQFSSMLDTVLQAHGFLVGGKPSSAHKKILPAWTRILGDVMIGNLN